MGKKYYVSNQEEYGDKARTLIVADEKDIEINVDLAGLVYVKKDAVDNIGEYRWEGIDGEMSMSYKHICDYMIADLEHFTSDDLDAIDCQIDDVELDESVVKKMKKHGREGSTLETYKAYEYWDGSNWREIVLESYYDTEYENHTESFENMQEIDYERDNTGEDTLYRLEDNRIIIIRNSFYQGSLWNIFFIDDQEVKTVEEANEWIREQVEGMM